MRAMEKDFHTREVGESKGWDERAAKRAKGPLGHDGEEAASQKGETMCSQGIPLSSALKENLAKTEIQQGSKELE